MLVKCMALCETFQVNNHQVYAGAIFKDHWSRFSGYHLHSQHATASLIFSSAFCCCPGIKEIEQDASVLVYHVLTVNCCNNNCVTLLHLASHLLRRPYTIEVDSIAVWLISRTAMLSTSICTPLSDYYKSNSEYQNIESESISQTSNLQTLFNISNMGRCPLVV